MRPLAPVFSSGQSLNFPSSGQNFNFSQNLLFTYNVSAQPLLPVASICSQVPFYIVSAVTGGQYVDFNLLLPINLGKLPSSMPYDVQLSRVLRTDLKKNFDFRDWSEAWAVYTSILSGKTPDKVPNLLAYFLLLSKAEKDLRSADWLGYGKLFREKAVSDKSLVWGHAEPS